MSKRIGRERIVFRFRELFGEPEEIVRDDCMNLIRYGLKHMLRDLPGNTLIGIVHELGDRELACPVNAHEEVDVAFGGLHLSNVDVEKADRVAIEALTFWLVAVDIRQAGVDYALTARQR